jgi:SAM-dependent methyltransferase
MKIPKDIIIQSDDSGRWILFNVFTYNTIATTTETMKVLSLVSKGSEPEEIKKQYQSEEFIIWEIGTFSNYDGLLANPTRRLMGHKEWPEPKSLGIGQLLDFLGDNNFIISDEVAYNEMFKPKTSLLDYDHIGNFHQQLGQELLVKKREDPGKWWVRQKFTHDYKGLNNTLYKAVQGHFLDSFIPGRFNSAHFVVDIGCGVGYYTKIIGKTGAKVLGIDPNEDYIRISKQNCDKNITFKSSGIGKKGDLDWIETSTADFVFMSDALLFYFVSPDPNQKQDIRVLLSDIRRILKPGGRFFSMEPSGLFWLRPWLGEEERPWTVLTEYNNKRFGVTPNYNEIIRAFIDGGFIIRDMKEIGVDDDFAKTDKRAALFADEYPLWWFFELEVEK